MAIIAQGNIFSWEKVDVASDLDRLRFVLEYLPDEELMKKLEKARRNGRDKYPIRPVWNSILAGIVYQHVSIESLRRELSRNAELRQICGFNVLKGSDAVPTEWVYSRFFKRLFKCENEINDIFDALVEKLRTLLPNFGEHFAIDGKAIESAGKASDDDPDGRRETDADWGKKTYSGKREDGTFWEKVKSWFGFKLHLIVDADYELPVAFDVTKASTTDTEMLVPMMEKLADKHPELVENTEDMSADRGYDSAKNNSSLLDNFGVKPIIDDRLMWKDGETTRPLFPETADNIVYDEKGTIFCAAPRPDDVNNLEYREMTFYGFEKDRKTLKYRCPAAAFGFECPNREKCGASDYGRIVRVPLELNRRIFIPTPRVTPKFERLYKKRTSVERVNSRLDVSFGFERHFIRGLKKMRLRVGLALIVMLAMAVGSIETGQMERMRSLVKPVKPKQAA